MDKMMIPKDVLVDAIIGCGFPTIDYAIKMEKGGLTRFTGNQWNEDWSWNREALEGLAHDLLYKIYKDCKA